jgi:hypothetical protein
VLSQVTCRQWIFNVVKKEKEDVLHQDDEGHQSCQHAECQIDWSIANLSLMIWAIGCAIQHSYRQSEKGTGQNPDSDQILIIHNLPNIFKNLSLIFLPMGKDRDADNRYLDNQIEKNSQNHRLVETGVTLKERVKIQILQN